MRSVGFLLLSGLFVVSALVLQVLRNGWLNESTLVLCLGFCMLLLALRYMLKFKALLASGVKDDSDGFSERAIVKYFEKTRNNESEVDKAISSIKDIGQPGFPELIRTLSDPHIRESLLMTHEKMSALRAKEYESSWLALGVSAITGLKHKGNDLTDYAYQVISSVVKYIKANQGCIFILRESDGEHFFELLGSYAYEKKKYVEKRISVGEGLIGQLYYEKELVLLTEIPKDYLRITSGLGDALPGFIAIVPLMAEGKIYGAMEVACFQKLSPVEIEYLRSTGETVGYALMEIDRNQTTEKLLAESTQMAQEVKSQEEELRQNMEELTATQEQMQRKQAEMDALLSSLSVIELDTNGVILEANSVFLGITGYHAGYLQHKTYLDLLPKEGADRMQYDLMWSSLMEGRTFSGEFRIVDSGQKEIWMMANFTPLLDARRKTYKIMVISMFNTEHKEKLVELQEMVATLKGCFPMVEVNPDLTFKSANELFLSELGIKRIELKRLALKDTFHNGSFKKVEKYFSGESSQADTLNVSMRCRDGEVRPFDVTMAKVNNHDRLKKGILILRRSEN